LFNVYIHQTKHLIYNYGKRKAVHALPFHRQVFRFSKANQIKIMTNIISILTDKLQEAKIKCILEYEIPNELQLQINKLMCDYSEALKKEKDGIRSSN